MGQTGNVWEWNESAFDGVNNSASEDRAFRGGNWPNSVNTLRASYRANSSPTISLNDEGFRVASVPEPSCAMLLLSAGLLALARRRRRAAL